MKSKIKIWRAYHQPTAHEMYFDYKPTKKELLKIFEAERADDYIEVRRISIKTKKDNV